MTVPMPGDFGGSCLIGECAFKGQLLLPSSSYFGLDKVASYLYCTWRDDDGNLLRVIRAVRSDSSSTRFVLVAAPGGQLEHDEGSTAKLWRGASEIIVDTDTVSIHSVGPGDEEPFRFVHRAEACSWTEGDRMSVEGRLLGPAAQWFNTWGGGACLTVTAKYRARGALLGRHVEGFVGHEVHYFSPGASWVHSPYGEGREYCWQHVANEYDDGSIDHATFATGADGWGFAMVHDSDGTFYRSTDVEVEATVRPNGYPETLTYRFLDQTWTWQIDPQGERVSVGSGTLIGADGTCRREGDPRTVRYSMANSDWWTDGRVGLDHSVLTAMIRSRRVTDRATRREGASPSA